MQRSLLFYISMLIIIPIYALSSLNTNITRTPNAYHKSGSISPYTLSDIHRVYRLSPRPDPLFLVSNPSDTQSFLGNPNIPEYHRTRVNREPKSSGSHPPTLHLPRIQVPRPKKTVLFFVLFEHRYFHECIEQADKRISFTFRLTAEGS